MKPRIFVVFGLLLPTLALAAPPSSKSDAALIAEGRHMVILGGCNFCHTVGWSDTFGKVPEKDWLEGNPVGWYGPWGTSYPINLRLFVPALSETTWVQFARAMRPRPPMPWYDVNQFSDGELRAIYTFLKYLGRAGVAAPADLDPGQIPTTAYIDMTVKPPAAGKS
jgi:hypothetical protein